jgi:hypothetical protein
LSIAFFLPRIRFFLSLLSKNDDPIEVSVSGLQLQVSVNTEEEEEEE